MLAISCWPRCKEDKLCQYRLRLRASALRASGKSARRAYPSTLRSLTCSLAVAAGRAPLGMTIRWGDPIRRGWKPRPDTNQAGGTPGPTQPRTAVPHGQEKGRASPLRLPLRQAQGSLRSALTPGLRPFRPQAIHRPYAAEGGCATRSGKRAGEMPAPTQPRSLRTGGSQPQPRGPRALESCHPERGRAPVRFLRHGKPERRILRLICGGAADRQTQGPSPRQVGAQDDTAGATVAGRPPPLMIVIPSERDRATRKERDPRDLGVGRARRRPPHSRGRLCHTVRKKGGRVARIHTAEGGCATQV